MIVKSVVLPLGQEAAFELFTRRISEWWPADRRHTGDPASEIVLLASGRFFEKATNGREVELGNVLSWERPHRILLDFFIGTSQAEPTEVEITFAPAPGGTCVTVTHRPKSVSSVLWTERAPQFSRSWDLVLAALLSKPALF